MRLQRSLGTTVVAVAVWSATALRPTRPNLAPGLAVGEKAIHLGLKANVQSAVAATTLTAALLGFGDAAHAASGDIATLQVGRTVIDIFVNSLSLLFLVRTVLSWYPKTNLNEFPYSIAAWPTEPLLVPVRSLIPPAFGVDVSSIVWIMLLSFFREIITGQQGVLTLLERQ
jgi:YggT family protein